MRIINLFVAGLTGVAAGKRRAELVARILPVPSRFERRRIRAPVNLCAPTTNERHAERTGSPRYCYNVSIMLVSLDVIIPCLNEERALPESVCRLHEFMSCNMGEYSWNIVVADNGSTDGTLEEAARLADRFAEVRYISLDQRGRGRALRRAWTESVADVMVYMDVDLSTDLAHLPELVSAVAAGGCHLAIGSRLLPQSRVIGRTLKREIASRGYSLLFRSMFFTPFRDAQCGFKAISRKVGDDLTPLVLDNGWFFDSELLILAQKCGFPIREIPVRWTDDPDTRVRILRTAWEDVKGLLRLRFGGASKVRSQLRAAGKL